jgi:hypothetical protein
MIGCLKGFLDRKPPESGNIKFGKIKESGAF